MVCMNSILVLGLFTNHSQIVYFYYSQCVIGHVVYFLLSGLMTETFWQGIANGEWQLVNNMQLGAFANTFKNINNQKNIAEAWVVWPLWVITIHIWAL